MNLKKESTGIKVGDIMTRSFISVSPDTNLIDCAREMTKKRVGSLVLKEGKRLAGLLTEKDIIWAMTKSRDLRKIKAKDIASRKVATIKPGADLYEALSRMKKLKFRRLPVVTEGSVIGLLTLRDILRIEPSLFTDVSMAEKIREESEKLKRLQGSKPSTDGICEECGSSSSLFRVDSRLLCGECKDSM